MNDTQWNALREYVEAQLKEKTTFALFKSELAAKFGLEPDCVTAINARLSSCKPLPFKFEEEYNDLDGVKGRANNEYAVINFRKL